MFGRNRTFPRWYAPILGGLLGVICAAEATRAKGIDAVYAVVIGAATGAIAGLIVFLLDSPPADVVEDGDELYAGAIVYRGSLVTRLLAVLTVAIVWVPLAGSIFGLMAVAANWRASGWPRNVSIAGFLLSLLSTGAGIIGMFLRK